VRGPQAGRGHLRCPCRATCGAVQKRAKELEKGNWGASAVSTAVARTAAAIAGSSAAVSVSVITATSRARPSAVPVRYSAGRISSQVTGNLTGPNTTVSFLNSISSNGSAKRSDGMRRGSVANTVASSSRAMCCPGH
jgi:hypothetical protein